MLKVHYLTKSNWSTALFEEAEFFVWEGMKVWLVWPNGSGKSTLLKILAWVDSEYTGKVGYTNKKARIGYIQQEIDVEGNESIMVYLKEKSWVAEQERILQKLYEQLNKNPTSNDLLQQVAETQTELEYLEYYQIDSKIETIITWLWFERNQLHTSVSELSWWQKRRVLLALMLIKWIDMILLDEPTNDLDFHAINWLTTYIKSLRTTAAIIVSHNRTFLNQIAKKIIAINTHTKKIDSYTWNYDTYEKIQTEALLRAELEYSRQQEKITTIEENIAIAQTQAIRSDYRIHDNDKWSRNKKIDNGQKIQWQIIRKLTSQMKRLDMKQPYRKAPLHFTLSTESNRTWSIIADDITYTYQNEKTFTVSVPHFEVKAWDKIVVIWANWSGKSTFINIIWWFLLSTSWSVQIPAWVDIWYMWQSVSKAEDFSLSIVKYIYKYKKKHIILDDQEVEKVLYQFEIQHTNKIIKDLSPWQKIRLQLALFFINQNNVLILDEPTNHLDIEAIQVLEEALHEYNWTLLVISHDEDFIEKIHPTSIYIMDNGYLKLKSQ